MSHTDSVADALTRVRNASRAGQPSVVLLHSSLAERLMQLLVREGFLEAVEVVAGARDASGGSGGAARKRLVVTLKYTPGRRQVFTELERVSRPGRRVYLGYADVRPVRSGMGVSILSSPKGLLTDADARRMKVGGEVLCRVW